MTPSPKVGCDTSSPVRRPIDSALLNEATTVVMQAITGLLEGIRGEEAPEKRWDPAEHGQSEFGRPEERA